MSTTPPRHGAPGCPCEDCLTARIAMSAALAADGRDLTGLRARLDGFKVCLTATADVLRNAS